MSLTVRIHKMLHSARNRSKEKGFPRPTINAAWLRERLQRGVCEVSGLALSPNDRTRARIPSIDRVDSRLPYTPENSRVVIWALNAAFAEWGADAFEPIARAWLHRRDNPPGSGPGGSLTMADLIAPLKKPPCDLL